MTPSSSRVNPLRHSLLTPVCVQMAVQHTAAKWQDKVREATEYIFETRQTGQVYSQELLSKITKEIVIFG